MSMLKNIEGTIGYKASSSSDVYQYLLKEDQNLTEQEVFYIRHFKHCCHYKTECKVNSDEQRSILEEALRKYLDFKDGKGGVIGREPMHRIIYAGNKYDIYDVFIFEQQCYAYALRSDIKEQTWQEGAFFLVNEAGRFVFFFDLSSFTIDVTASAAYSALLQWYICLRRGLGLPEILTKEYWNVLMSNKEVLYQITNNELYMQSYLKLGHSARQLSYDENSEVTESLLDYGYLRIHCENLLSRPMSGYYRNQLVHIIDGSCINSNGKIASTPIGNNLILDLIPLTVCNGYIAMTCKMKKAGNLLSRKWIITNELEYYSIMKDNDSHKLNIEKIHDDDISYFCKPYFERFALVYMNAKVLMPYIFCK